jgi:hypothetical protein
MALVNNKSLYMASSILRLLCSILGEMQIMNIIFFVLILNVSKTESVNNCVKVSMKEASIIFTSFYLTCNVCKYVNM